MPNRRLTPFLTTLLICAAAISVSTPAASASAVSREARRAAHEATRAAREAQRDARRTERAQLRREREERRAARAAERAGHDATQTEAAPGEGAGEDPAPIGATGQATCAISAEPSAHSVTTGEAVTISGKLTCPALEEVSGQSVTVEQLETGGASSTPTVVATVTTANDGSYQFHSTGLNARSTFLLQTADTPRHARVVIQVDAAISLQGPAASGSALTMWNGHLARAANVAGFSGTVRPQAAETAVALKVRYAGGAWHKVAGTRTDAQGNFSFHHRFRYAGAVSVVAVTRPRGERRTTSTELTYTIVQAQNPALTIGRPATAPAALAPAPGQAALAPEPTTITGIVSAGGGHTVTLLARALGSGHFAPVATTVSDASGAYSFTVDPAATTVYEVTCGGQHSTPLGVDVS